MSETNEILESELEYQPTFAAYFRSDEIWYLHSWGIERQSIPEIAEEILRDECHDAIKFEPTPHNLAKISENS